MTNTTSGSCSASALRVLIVGFGDVGQSYAKALVAQGVMVHLYHPAPREHAVDAARRLGLEFHTVPSAAYAGCDLALNVAPGSQVLTVAQAAASHMQAGALFADLSSAAPHDVRTAASLFAQVDFVDVAIMGAVSIHGHRTPLLASGDRAHRLQALLAPLGFSVQALPDSLAGDATALKLVRSVLTKGMDGVIIECLLVAEALGLRQTLLSNIGDLDSSRLSELMAMFVRTHAPHAQRRLHEMEAVEKTLQNLGVPLIVTPAIRRRYERTVEVLGPAAQLPQGAQGDALFDRVLPWMLLAERRDSASPATLPEG